MLTRAPMPSAQHWADRTCNACTCNASLGSTLQANCASAMNLRAALCIQVLQRLLLDPELSAPGSCAGFDLASSSLTSYFIFPFLFEHLQSSTPVRGSSARGNAGPVHARARANFRRRCGQASDTPGQAMSRSRSPSQKASSTTTRSYLQNQVAQIALRCRQMPQRPRACGACVSSAGLFQLPARSRRDGVREDDGQGQETQLNFCRPSASGRSWSCTFRSGTPPSEAHRA